MTCVAVAPNKYARGMDGTGRPVPDAYEVMELVDALQRTYATDAHFVTYVFRGRERQARLNKGGLPYVTEIPEVGVVVADVDNADHAEWTPELMAEAIEQEERLSVLSSAGVYYTTHGRRVVQPIARPIPVDRVEPHVRHWLRELERAGLAVDWACRDWTRHFRLPHVRRGGRPFRSPRIALQRMREVELPAGIEEDVVEPASTERHVPRVPPPVLWTPELPDFWRPKVELLAAAVRGVTDAWHPLFLTLAGALLGRGVPHEHLPAFCRALSLATGADNRTADRETAARTTVTRKLQGLPIRGYGELRRSYPSVAAAMNEAFPRAADARFQRHARAVADAPLCSPAETVALLERAIAEAPDGVTILSAECGIGKTQAALRVAMKRAATPYATRGASGLRAPPQSKTVLSVDKNALAIQVANDLRRQGVAVKRYYGPLSVLRADGTPECRYVEHARPLIEGGQSLHWEFCQGRGTAPCEHYDTCPARKGVDGPLDARITIGPHALLPALVAEAGKTGLLVIDEPPSALETTVLSVDELDTAIRHLPLFAARYATAMRPALRAARAWTAELAELEQVRAPKEVLVQAAPSIADAELGVACRAVGIPRSGDPAADVIACVLRAHDPQERRSSPSPPILAPHVFAARRALHFAQELGAASRALHAVYRACARGPVSLRVEERGRARALVITMAREELAAALRRDGATVLMDASADLHVPIIERIVQYKPPVHAFRAGDGAPIERTILLVRGATRREWFVGGRLTLDDGMLRAVAAVFEWARGAERLGIITFQALELALRLALRPTDPALIAEWKQQRQGKAALARIRSELSAIVGKWDGELLLAHYGAVRGLDSMAHVDALATLGDPWPHVGDVQHEVAFLGLEDDWRQRLAALCTAELEQAHGRLRAVHRTRPARALHVGAVRPGGTGWSTSAVQVRTLPAGRPKNQSTMTIGELDGILKRLGGGRATARALGCGVRTLARYASGERAVPAALAVDLRVLAAGGQLEELE